MTTHIITDCNEKVLAIVEDDREKAEHMALVAAVNTAHTVTVTDSPLSLANARLQAKWCPDCGSANVTFGYLPNNWDPGDVEPTATCNDCGWGY